MKIKKDYAITAGTQPIMGQQELKLVDFFTTDEQTQHIKREKAKAREMRKSRWWQNRIHNASCYYCQKPLFREDVTMDHVVPLSRGGKTTKGNVVPACKACNNHKKNLTPIEWTHYIEGKLSS